MEPWSTDNVERSLCQGVHGCISEFVLLAQDGWRSERPVFCPPIGGRTSTTRTDEPEREACPDNARALGLSQKQMAGVDPSTLAKGSAVCGVLLASSASESKRRSPADADDWLALAVTFVVTWELPVDVP